MVAILTRADSLREYLTGAGSDGGVQTDPQASLGNFASSTEAASIGIVISGTPIVNLTVDYAAGGNNLGAGILTLVDGNTVHWADNGNTAGADTVLTNGVQTIVESAGGPGHFLRVTRTSAAAMTGGPETITLAALVNNLFGMDDVSAVNAAAGITEYFASILKNVSAAGVANIKRFLRQLGTQQISNAAQLGASGAGTITTTGTFADWPTSGWCRIETSGGTLREIVYYSSRTSTSLTVPSGGRARLGTSSTAGAATDNIYSVPGIAIGIDSAGVQASGSSIQTVGSTTSPPTGITWNTGITAASGLNIGGMNGGQLVGIWMKREIPAGVHSNTQVYNWLRTGFDAA